MKYTLVGAGAMGASLCAWISKEGGDILYVDVVPEHIQAMNKKGITIRDPKNIDFTVPVNAVSMNELQGPLEVVLLAVKTQNTREAMEKVAPLLSKNGYIVSLQNGINEYVIAEYVGKKRVVGAFINWASDYIGPGEIKFGGRGNFMIGELNGRKTERLCQLQTFFAPFQRPEISSNIMCQLWSKQVNICVMFSTGISHLLIPGGLDYEPTQKAIACIALEAMQVPKKLGIELVSFEDFEPKLYYQGLYQKALQITADHYRRMTKNYTGLYRDLAIRKRKSEIEGTVGAVVAMGEKEGLSLPLNRKLVSIVKEIEEGRRPISTENMLELQSEYERLYPKGFNQLLTYLNNK